MAFKTGYERINIIAYFCINIIANRMYYPKSLLKLNKINSVYCAIQEHSLRMQSLFGGGGGGGVTDSLRVGTNCVHIL